jgi:predicted transposase/invertase (TIGR01784 family)
MLTIEFEKLPTYRMGWDRGHEEGREEGRKEGKQEGAHNQAVAIARKLLDMGLDNLQIASATGLPVADIDRLRIAKTD